MHPSPSASRWTILRQLLWLLLPAGLEAQAPALVRGPYLQMASPTAITVCWRTATEAAGRIRFGTDAGALTGSAEESAPAINHEVRLTGLTAATHYYYAVEAGETPLASGPSFHFFTPPADGAADSVRFWVLGDCGTQTAAQRMVRDAFAPLHAQRRADLWLMLGDNAYYNATDALYQGAVFDMYPDYLRSVPLWSCIGNHETLAGPDPGGKFAFDNIFAFPVSGECGGVASGTERYYSWNYGRVHFICLDSMTTSRAADGPMVQWLTSDLQANLQPWVVAFWHHPPYSKGSHDSDGEIEHIEMRANILPVLENYGVDLVLSGHSHNYERSWLLDGHYGHSTSLTAANKKGPGDGRENGDGPYYKAGAGMNPHQGAVYITAGSSGQTGGGNLDHPAHYIAMSRLGSLVVDVNGNRMDVKFLREAATPDAAPVFDDYFSLIKGVPPPPAPALVRGPYLQMPAPGAMTVRWRTDVPCSGRIRYGTGPGALPLTASEAAPGSRDHSVRLTGLLPGTTYYYSVESAGTALASGPAFHFTTPPPDGSRAPVRIWALGDSGTQGPAQLAVRDAFLSVHAQRPADLWLMLGDNAYGAGTDSEYQSAVFDVYHPWLEQVPLWSCIGNHETYGAAEDGKFSWDSIFEFPVNGECGGVASGTERYYSWNHANIHFIALDSMTSSRTADGPMARWLTADLQANLQPWIIALWHHPPYTKGSHDSDFEEELVEMRENILPILESHGVDLVLCGHSHGYERSWLLDGHYGDSSLFSPSYLLDDGDGRENGDGAYRKPVGPAVPRQGAVYVVAGSSGSAYEGTFDHPVHYAAMAELGSLVIDVHDQRMDVRFLLDAETPLAPPVYADYFTILKGGPAKPAAPAGLAVLPLDATSALLHWEDSEAGETQWQVLLSTNGTDYTAGTVLPADSTAYLLSGLTANAPVFVKAVVTNPAGSAASAPLTYKHPSAPGPVSLMERWRFMHWGGTTPEAERADLADADGDGSSNLIEYALGSMPRGSGSHPQVSAALNAQGHLAVTFQRTADPLLNYTVEYSSSLAPESWVTGFTSTGPANSAGPVTATESAAASGGRRFARIRVQLATLP